MLDGYFAELIDVYNIYIYYGFSLITCDQFRDPEAYAIFSNTFLKASIAYDKAKFDLCVKKKWVKPFDTKALATFLNNNIIVGTLIRTHEDMNHETAYDVSDMFRSLKQFVLNSVKIVEQKRRSRPK